MSMATAADSPVTDAAAGSVAFVAFSTESPHGSRGDVHLADLARLLRRDGIPCRVFHVHLDFGDPAENRRRVDRLLERLVSERCRWAVFKEVWTAELGKRIRALGIRVVETRSHSFDDAIYSDDADLAALVRDCATGTPLDETANLVEIVGPRVTRTVTSIDLRVEQACGYKRGLEDNPFYRDVLDSPTVAAHRGCAHCLNAQRESLVSPERSAAYIVERIRNDRQTFPDLATFWMQFAETFYDALAIAFQTTRGDPVWHGITLAMQCRPDVIAERATEIEALGAQAAECGTRLRIGVVGFENFSPPEILVLNRGVTPEHLDATATILNRWADHPPPGLVVRGFVPSFILFTPWTRLEDLDLNLGRIARHGLWNANIERLRVGPATPAFEKARRAGLVADGPPRSPQHPNGYLAERDVCFADPLTAAAAEGFETLRSLAPNDQPELLTAVVDAVRRAPDAARIDWKAVAATWSEIVNAAQHPAPAAPEGDQARRADTTAASLPSA
jgi:hypothetical protein